MPATATPLYRPVRDTAWPLAKLAGVSYLPDALVRRRATESQGGKSGAHRKRNVAGAFPSGAFGAGALPGGVRQASQIHFRPGSNLRLRRRLDGFLKQPLS